FDRCKLLSSKLSEPTQNPFARDGSDALRYECSWLEEWHRNGNLKRRAANARGMGDDRDECPIRTGIARAQNEAWSALLRHSEINHLDFTAPRHRPPPRGRVWRRPLGLQQSIRHRRERRNRTAHCVGKSHHYP